MQGGLVLFASFINRRIDVLELSARVIFNNLRPRVIGFAEGDSVSVSRAAISAESFIRAFGHMWASHHYRDSRSANGVGHPVGLLNHPRHGADTNQANVLVAKEPHQLLIVQRLCVAV